MELAIGILTSLMANINRDPKKRPEPFGASDFMVDWTKQLEPAAPEPEDDGMSGERLTAVMDSFMRQQAIRGKALG